MLNGETTAGGGIPPAAWQSGPGGPGGNRGNENAASAAATTSPDRGAAGNQTGGERSPANGGLATVLAGGPEAGAGGNRGNENAANAAATALPDQNAGQPKGKPGTNQSNDNTTIPVWASQLSRKLTSNPETAAALAAYKNLDEFVQAYLDARPGAGGGQPPAVPGKDASPEEVRAFYERLGKPPEEAGYAFAQSDPAFARDAFAANLTRDQADALYSASLARLEATRKGIKESLNRDIQATDALLRREYGDKYAEAMALFGRGLGNNPATGRLSPIAEILVDAGLAGKSEIVRAFIELGRARSEGSPAGGGAAAAPPDSIMSGRALSYKDSYG